MKLIQRTDLRTGKCVLSQRGEMPDSEICLPLPLSKLRTNSHPYFAILRRTDKNKFHIVFKNKTKLGQQSCNLKYSRLLLRNLNIFWYL